MISRVPPNPASDRADFYGLGWNVSYDGAGRVRLGHSGAFSLGAATAVALLPGEQLGIVVLTNSAPIGVPEAVCATFFDLVSKGKADKDWFEQFQPIFTAMARPEHGTATDYSKPPASKSPPLALETYVGNYGNDYYGEMQIAENDNGIILRIGPKKRPFPLRHWDRDVFLYQPEGENAGPLSAVTFLVGPDRKATRAVIENLDIHGQGTFARAAAAKQ
jgi:hypothetical protein